MFKQQQGWQVWLESQERGKKWKLGWNGNQVRMESGKMASHEQKHAKEHVGTWIVESQSDLVVLTVEETAVNHTLSTPVPPTPAQNTFMPSSPQLFSRVLMTQSPPCCFSALSLKDQTVAYEFEGALPLSSWQYANTFKVIVCCYHEQSSGR